jgi:hypothetical protein
MGFPLFYLMKLFIFLEVSSFFLKKGYNGKERLNDLYSFDIIGNKWKDLTFKQKGSIPSKRVFFQNFNFSQRRATLVIYLDTR